MDRVLDYDYIDDFFDDKKLLEKFMLQFDGWNLKVNLNHYNNAKAKELLLEGDDPHLISLKLEMKVNTVHKIKYRMMDKVLEQHIKE